jgi:uncharacterized protein (DUF952 family)/RimJ/RimL family protein N-acetyltransferase
MITIRPVIASDADALFPLVYQSSVTDTLLWDGPESLVDFRKGLTERQEQTALGESHVFTIVEQSNGCPVGSASIRPDADFFRGSVGLWVGQPYHGKGYGTRTIRELTKYSFERLHLEKIDADVFVGNRASRRIFEKNGYQVEGTIRNAVRKRGAPVDEWHVGVTRRDYMRWRGTILHLCNQREWESALNIGEYRAASLEREGFIHCSRPEQILDVANRYYQKAVDTVLLQIDLQQVQPPIRWDLAEGDDFPHIYGALNLSAVAKVLPFTCDTDGKFRQFPDV